MSRILFVLLCCFVLEVQAIVMTPDQPQPETPQVAPATTSKLSPPHSHARKSPEKKQTNQPAEKQVWIPIPFILVMGVVVMNIVAFKREGQQVGSRRVSTSIIPDQSRKSDTYLIYLFGTWLIPH